MKSLVKKIVAKPALEKTVKSSNLRVHEAGAITKRKKCTCEKERKKKRNTRFIPGSKNNHGGLWLSVVKFERKRKAGLYGSLPPPLFLLGQGWGKLQPEDLRCDARLYNAGHTYANRALTTTSAGTSAPPSYLHRATLLSRTFWIFTFSSFFLFTPSVFEKGGKNVTKFKC